MNKMAAVNMAQPIHAKIRFVPTFLRISNTGNIISSLSSVKGVTANATRVERLY